MFEFKPILKTRIPAALARAEKYRLLNEPSRAESICLDVLATDPEHHDANVMLLLALTDQFRDEAATVEQARELLSRFDHDYDKHYYAGIIFERQAIVLAKSSKPDAFDWFKNAMDCYEKAEAARRFDESDDAILRWNTCVRLIERFKLKA